MLDSASAVNSTPQLEWYQGLEVIVCKLGILQASSLRMKRLQMNVVHSSVKLFAF